MLRSLGTGVVQLPLSLRQNIVGSTFGGYLAPVEPVDPWFHNLSRA